MRLGVEPPYYYLKGARVRVLVDRTTCAAPVRPNPAEGIPPYLFAKLFG